MDMNGIPPSTGPAAARCLDALTLECTPRFNVRDMAEGMTTSGRELKVAELASAVQVSPDTIRYYERERLLAAPRRSPAGYRLYAPEVVERVRFIQGCQRLGLRLREIADLLTIRDTGVCPCASAADLLQQRLVEIDTELQRLKALRAKVAAIAQALPAPDCPPPAPGTWCPPTLEGGGDPTE